MGSGADALCRPRGLRRAHGKERRAGSPPSSAGGARRADRPRLFVRVNGLTTGLIDDDLDGVMAAGPDGIVLPKTVGGADVRISARSSRSGRRSSACPTAARGSSPSRPRRRVASSRLASSGRQPSPVGLAWGGEDLSVDVGAETNRGTTARTRSPTGWRPASPFGRPRRGGRCHRPVYTHFRDRGGSRRNAVPPAATASSPRWRSTRPGPRHQRGVHPLRTGSRPRPEVIAVFAETPGAGVVGVEGEMLDRPHLGARSASWRESTR